MSTKHKSLAIASALTAMLCASAVAADSVRLPEGTSLASDLVGAKILDLADHEHAKVVDLMVDCSAETVPFAVVHCSGHDDVDFAVPLSELRITRNEDGDREIRISPESIAKQKSFPEGDFNAAARIRVDDLKRAGDAMRRSGETGLPGDAKPGDTRLHRASKVIGKDIENPKGDDLGTIDDLVVKNDGSIPYAVVSVGGFLGIGDEQHAVPLDRFRAKTDADDAKLVLNATKEQLENGPRFPRAEYPDPGDRDYLARLHDHYGTSYGSGLAFATDGGRVDKASDIVGANVKGVNGDAIGSIDDLILNRGHGSVAFAVVSVGGFLGIGDKLVAVPWQALRPSPNEKGAYTLDVTKETLEALPTCDKEMCSRLADAGYRRTLYAPFGVSDPALAQIDGSAAGRVEGVRMCDLVDKDLTGSASNEDVGEVEDLAIDRDSGKVRYAVVSLEDQDDELFAVKLTELKAMPEKSRVRLDSVTQATVLAERGFPKDHWPSGTRGSN